MITGCPLPLPPGTEVVGSGSDIGHTARSRARLTRAGLLRAVLQGKPGCREQRGLSASSGAGQAVVGAEPGWGGHPGHHPCLSAMFVVREVPSSRGG